MGVLQLLGKVELDTQFSAMPGLPYDITAGTDANGDGDGRLAQLTRFILKRCIRPAATRAKITQRIGWHIFRHTLSPPC